MTLDPLRIALLGFGGGALAIALAGFADQLPVQHGASSGGPSQSHAKRGRAAAPEIRRVTDDDEVALLLLLP